MQKVYDFLVKCGTFYVATVEDNKPRVRPFGVCIIFEDKLYIATAKVKAISKQLEINPNVEICAADNELRWLRIQATAVNDQRKVVKEKMLELHPEISFLYSAEDPNFQLLYLKDASAYITKFGEEPEIIMF